MADNKELTDQFAEQIGEAMVKLGPDQAFACMARMMCALAACTGHDLEFKCDYGLVSVSVTMPKLHS